MAVVGGVLGAEEAGVVQGLPGRCLLYTAFPHQGQEFPLVAVPVFVVLLEAVEDLLARGEGGEVDVVHAADFSEEEWQVTLLGKSCQLIDVIQTDVDHPLGPRLPQQLEEPRSGNLGETYGEDFQNATI